jgi:carboxyl-terminal processing protease
MEPAQSADSASGPETGEPAAVVPPPEPPRSRRGIWAALIGVAILSAGALFLSGYTLGTQRSLTPGTSADQQQLFAPYWEAYDKIASSYVGAFSPKSLVEGSIKGMFESLNDPFSSYMTSEEYQASLSGISGEFEGIGAEMASVDSASKPCTPLGSTCRLEVVRIIRDSPAQQAGLQAGDVISAVDGGSVAGMSIDDVVSRIRGPRLSQVRLTFTRAGTPMELTITRDTVQSEDVIETSLDGGAVTDLKITGFSSSAADDVKKMLSDSLAAGVRRFVIDLRDDPGGFVGTAESIANQFIASGPIYWEEDAKGNDTEHDATGDGVAIDPGIAVVVLVNGGTASASEILTGALHDSGRATVIGTKTYGKGTVQQWILLSNDSGGFRLSIAKWLTPDKTWIHGVGITPDVVMAQPDDLALGQDPQLDRALEVLEAKPLPVPSGSAALGSPAPVSSAAQSETASPSAQPAPTGPSGRLPDLSLASISAIG